MRVSFGDRVKRFLFHCTEGVFSNFAAINKSFFEENTKNRGNINPVASNKSFLYNQIFILQDVELIL